MAKPQHSTYRSLVHNMWADGRIVPEEVTTLTTMQAQLAISPEDAASIEREVMGQTKEEALVAGMGTNVPSSPPLDSQSAPSPGSSDVLGTFSGGRTLVSASDEQTGPRTLSGRATSAGSDARSSRPGHLQAGDLVADRFEILGVLGEGGMGQVLKVRDTKLDAVRAMKVIRPELLHRGDILQRFRHEVTTSQKLAHPNIVRVFDYGEDEARGIHFLTMEFVDGMTLRKWLQQKRRAKAQVSVKEFTAIAQGLCAALQYAHRFTVHRDLKPENIMLDRASRGIKLMDFGIAKAFGANKQFTTAGPMGTVYYAAPEQERGEQVDQRADIYSMGVILYEVLSGEIPRAGSKPIGEVRSDVSANVAKAIETAMATSPGDRFSSVTVFAKVLFTTVQIQTSEAMQTPTPPEPRKVEERPEASDLAPSYESLRNTAEEIAKLADSVAARYDHFDRSDPQQGTFDELKVDANYKAGILNWQGGALVLSETELSFRPHGLNFGDRGTKHLKYSDILDVSKSGINTLTFKTKSDSFSVRLWDRDQVIDFVARQTSR